MKRILMLVLVLSIFTHFYVESYAAAAFAPELYAYYYSLFGEWFGLEEKEDTAFGLTEEQVKQLEEDLSESEDIAQSYGDEGLSIIIQNPYVLEMLLRQADVTLKAKEADRVLWDHLNQALIDSGRAPLSPDVTLDEFAQSLSDMADKIFLPFRFNTDHLKNNLNDFISKEFNIKDKLLPYEYYLYRQEMIGSMRYTLISGCTAFHYDEATETYRFRTWDYHLWEYADGSSSFQESNKEHVCNKDEFAYFRSRLYNLGYKKVGEFYDSNLQKNVKSKLNSLFDSLEKQRDRTFGISLSAIQNQKIRRGDVVLLPSSSKPGFSQKEDGTLSVPDVLPSPVSKDNQVPLIPPISSPVTDAMDIDIPFLPPSVLPPSTIPDVVPDIAIPGVTDIVRPIPDTDILNLPVPVPSELPFIGPIIDLIKALLSLLRWIVEWLRDFLLNLLKMLMNMMLSLFVPKQGFLTIIYEKIKLNFGDISGYVDALKPLMNSKTAAEFEDLYVNMYGSRIKILDGQFVRQNINFYHKLVRAFMFPLIIIFNLRKLQGILNGSGQSDIAGAQGNLTGSAAEVKS